MAQLAHGAKRRRHKKVWNLSAVIALVAVSFNLAFADSSVRFVPASEDEPASESRSIQGTTAGEVANAETQGTEIRIIGPNGQSTVSVRKIVTQPELSDSKSADRSNVGTVVIRSVTSGRSDLLPQLSSASATTPASQPVHSSAPVVSQSAAPIKSEAPDLFSRLFAITEKDYVAPPTTPAAKAPAIASTEAADLGPGLRQIKPQMAATQKPAPVVARTEAAKTPEVAIARTLPATPAPATVIAKSNGPDLFGPLHKEASAPKPQPSFLATITAPKPEVSPPVVANNTVAKPTETLAQAEPKPLASVTTERPTVADHPLVAQQEPKATPTIASTLSPAAPSSIKEVNAMPLPAVDRTVVSAPVVQPPRVPTKVDAKAKIAETKPSQVVTIPATPKALESMIAANTRSAPPAPVVQAQPVIAQPVAAQPTIAPPVIEMQPAPTVVAAATAPAPVVVPVAPIVAPAAPEVAQQIVKSSPVAAITPVPSNDDWKNALQAQPQPQRTPERVATATPTMHPPVSKPADQPIVRPADTFASNDTPQPVGKFAYGDVQKPLVTLAQDTPKPVRTDYAMLQLTSPPTGAHAPMVEPMPDTSHANMSGPMPAGAGEAPCGPNCGPTGCPYRPLQSGEQNICGVDCGNCAAPCSAMWRDSQCIPWSLFGPGEYVGPARTEHVSTYFLRVNDVITLTFISSHRKEAERYRIGCGDRLKLEWLRGPQDSDRALDREVLVQPDGSIALPLVGEVNASGKTVQELQDELTKAFGKFQRDPQITVTPMDFNLAQKDIIAAVTSVSGSNGQTQALKVTPEGTIQAPGVGSVFVQGLTLDELRNELESRYLAAFGPGLLISPSLTQRAPMFTFVGGEVTKPGRYELEGPTTVMQAITLAGGWNVGGNLHQVVVFRRDENWCLKATKIDIRAPFYGQDPCPANDVWLRDNDLVIVPKSRILCATDAIQLYFTRGIYAVFPITYVYDFSKTSAVVVP